MLATAMHNTRRAMIMPEGGQLTCTSMPALASSACLAVLAESSLAVLLDSSASSASVCRLCSSCSASALGCAAWLGLVPEPLLLGVLWTCCAGP